jgi:hypothetical protein
MVSPSTTPERRRIEQVYDSGEDMVIGGRVQPERAGTAGDPGN